MGMQHYLMRFGGLPGQNFLRHHKHVFMESEKYGNKRGVGILLNKKCRQTIIDTECINERAITTSIFVNQQRIKLMSVYFLHSGYADHHVKTCTDQSRNTRPARIACSPIVGGDFQC